MESICTRNLSFVKHSAHEKKNRPIPSTIHINNKTPKVSELNYDIDQKHENMSFDTSFEHPEKGNCMYSSI